MEFTLIAEVQPVLAFSKAKLRRILADSKKNARFFSKLYGQMPELWTN
jgi:hypothetical protein